MSGRYTPTDPGRRAALSTLVPVGVAELSHPRRDRDHPQLHPAPAIEPDELVQP